MARKGKKDAEPPTDHEAPSAPVQEVVPGDGSDDNGQVKNKPCKSFSVAAGGGVYIEASIWPKEIAVDDRTVTVFSVTCRKSYTKEGGGYGNTMFFRGSELYLLQYVLGCASQWILDQRRMEDPAF